MKWIKCSDRLPAENKAVLAIGRWRMGACEWVERYLLAWYTSEGWAADQGLVNGQVTHWMPLPNPPESEDKECI